MARRFGTWQVNAVLLVKVSLLACAGVTPSPVPSSAEETVGLGEVVEASQQAEIDVPLTGEVVGRFAKPSTAVLFQSGTGLFDGNGRYLGPYGGWNDIRDLLVIDAAQSSFFLRSDDDDTVRVVRREGNEFVVRRVLENARVVQPMGRVALVRGIRDDNARIVDAAGRVIHEGLVPTSSAGLPVPLTEPEYWWVPSSFFELPTPVCTEGQRNRRCGWLQPDGSWLGAPDRIAVTSFETGWAKASTNQGEVWLDTTGEPFFAASVATDWNWRGRATDDGHLLVGKVSRTPEGGQTRETWRFEVVARDGRRAPVQADLLREADRYHCAYGNGECQYRFHEQRAAVWVAGPAGAQAAYLGPDGKFVVEPSPCAHPNPSGPFRDDRAFHCDGDGYWMIDRSGRRIAGPYPGWVGDPLDPSPNTYANGLFFSDGLAAVPVSGGWGYVDRTGRAVLPGPYDIARPFRQGIALVARGDDIYYIRKDGSRTLEGP